MVVLVPLLAIALIVLLLGLALPQLERWTADMPSSEPGPHLWVSIAWGLVLIWAGLSLMQPREGDPFGLVFLGPGIWLAGGVAEILDASLGRRRGWGWRMAGGMIGFMPLVWGL